MTPNDQALFQWSDAYELGFSRIDGEHRYLVKLIGDAIGALDDEAEDDVGDLVTRFVEACRYHFFSEEQLMRDIGYDHVEIHVQYHTKLLEMADVLARRCAEDHDATALKGDVVALAKCLLDDVISGDKSLLPYLERKGLL